MLRKFTICGVMLFISPGTMVQLCASIVTGAFFFVIHVKFQPFENDVDDNLQSAALLATFLTLVSATVIRSGENGTNTEIFIMAVNVLVLVSAGYALIVDTIPKAYEEYSLYWAAATDMQGSLQDATDDLAEMDMHTEVVSGATSGATILGSQDPSNCVTRLDKDEVLLLARPMPKDEDNAELDEQIERLFRRYDLDASGTVNSFDELEQLCCNLGYRLELELNPKDIDMIISNVKEETPYIEWDLPTFSVWFKQKFLGTV